MMLEKEGFLNSNGQRLLRFFLIFFSLASLYSAVEGQPAVVATAEGQIGETPIFSDTITGPSFESIRGSVGEVFFSRIVNPAFLSPEFSFFTDRIHGVSNPNEIDAFPNPFTNVFDQTATSSWSRKAADDGDFVAFSFAVDGATPSTMTVRIATFDETGSSMINVPITTNLPTFPDPLINKTGVAVDNQGRATVAYTEFDFVNPPKVKAQRLDSTTGTVLDVDFLVDNGFTPDVALLDPAGNRLIIATSELVGGVQGNVLDFSGVSPQVQPAFPISTTGGIANLLPVVAADPNTGAFTAAWENLADLPGDPVNVRARRFDAMGNPVGNDFVVNTTTANAQGQPGIAFGSQGESVVVWAGDAALATDKLDVFAQVYDAMGQPIGGEIRVNTVTDAVQDRPAVRFLPEADSQGRPQFVVAWRDVGQADGTEARGTGTSYRCFSIEGLGDPSAIFADGFESGDTTSWSDEQP